MTSLMSVSIVYCHHQFSGVFIVSRGQSSFENAETLLFEGVVVTSLKLRHSLSHQNINAR